MTARRSRRWSTTRWRPDTPIRLLTIFGTRPEIIRLSRIVPLLDAHAGEHLFVHTGQNYAASLSDIFFRELGVRDPDVHLGIRAGGFAEQAAKVIELTDKLMAERRPDRVLVLGDTNSGLAAIAAARRGIPVFHLEAGNRCYDDRVPEEINRRIIDHCSTVLLPYTERSKENLVREGIERERIFVVGNPIFEVLSDYEPKISASQVLSRFSVLENGYVLVTMHRAENVDLPDRLERLFEGLRAVAADTGLPVIYSVHPRAADRIQRGGLASERSELVLSEPLGFFDFVRLERGAACVVTDSGTVQEECAIQHIPNVTIRDVTERPETIEVGSNIIAGSDPSELVAAVRLARGLARDWIPPREYVVPRPSTAIAKIALGHTSIRHHTD